MRARLIVLCVAAALVAVGCGNASSSKPSAGTAPSGGSVTVVTGADLQKNVPVTAQGVTDKAINVATVTAKTNFLGGHYAEYADGIQAYFDYINSQGGIYGRRLKIKANRDDHFTDNEKTVKASLAQDKAFATFIATPLFTGVPDIATSKPRMPTFIWNINPEMAGHDNIFGTIGAICNNCIDMGGPQLAKTIGAKKVGVFAYGTTASSKDCGNMYKNAFKHYPVAKVAYFNNNIAFAQADVSAQVSDMKKAGVQLIFTCIDTNESVVLGKEIKRQGLDAVQTLPNAYDQQFVHDNAQYLEGDYVQTQFVPPEKDVTIPEEQTFKQWMDKSGKTIRELSYEGWIAANMFVHGLKLAGPNFTQQKLIDSLNRDTNFTAGGMIEPIDWTKAHNDPRLPDGTHNPKYEGKWNCSTSLQVKAGKFVPVFDQPGKPWVCLGPQNQPTLPATVTYENFSPTENGG
jgi:branched-chain amino acid transport system substrate-binding protein